MTWIPCKQCGVPVTIVSCKRKPKEYCATCASIRKMKSIRNSYLRKKGLLPNLHQFHI